MEVINNQQGRPQFDDTQYQKWLDDMSAFLKLGNTLWYAMEKADLLQHKDAIYGKYKLNDWFSEKIDVYRRQPGEIVNSIFTRLIMAIDDKIKQGLLVGEEEWRNLRWYAEKHRSAQPFFVNRNETAQVDFTNIGKIIASLDAQPIQQVDDLAEEAQRHLQNQLQNRADSALAATPQ